MSKSDEVPAANGHKAGTNGFYAAPPPPPPPTALPLLPPTRTRTEDLAAAAPDISCDDAEELSTLAEVIESRARSQEQIAQQLREAAEAAAQDAASLHGLAETAAEVAADRLEECANEAEQGINGES